MSKEKKHKNINYLFLCITKIIICFNSSKVSSIIKEKEIKINRSVIDFDERN